MMTNEKKPIALIVEDDENLANAFGYALDSFDVTIFYHGDKALEWLKEGNTPKVAVLDLNLPGVSGSDLLDYIRAQENLKDTRVFLATANHNLADSLCEQADLVLLKPVGYQQLQLLADRFK